MIKIPERIKKAIYECAEFNEQAKIREKEIIKWMERMKITEETATDVTRNMDDSFIDCCQITNNPEEFIEIVENLDKN